MENMGRELWRTELSLPSPSSFAGWQRGTRDLRSNHPPCESPCLAGVYTAPARDIEPWEGTGVGHKLGARAAPLKRSTQNSPVQSPHCSTAGSSRSPWESWPPWAPWPPWPTRSPLPQRKAQHWCAHTCARAHTCVSVHSTRAPPNLPVFASRGCTPCMPSHPASSR